MRAGRRAAYRLRMAADQPAPRQDRRPDPRRTALRTLAIVVAVGLGLAGLLMAGYLVLVLVALGSYGSNK